MNWRVFAFLNVILLVTAAGQTQTHWSFIKPVRPSLPATRNSTWSRNAIDRFILARLEKEGLEPSREADRETLIRRVSFDLTGLPPTPQEIDAFLADQSPLAYEKVVDRLLGSPRYGERMAFRWLDAARYADTNGYQIDGDRYMWRWRDWVIDAFNSNKPYDQFIIEQLAGDLLPNPTLDQRIATAFNRNHRINAEGGIVPEEYRVEYVVDRVDTTSTVFMGLTVGCARCHNHKFDPITQKEFYQLSAYFNSIPEDGRAMDWGNSAPWIFAPTRQQQSSLDQLSEKIASEEKHFESLKTKSANLRLNWEKTRTNEEQWFPNESLLMRLPMDDKQAPVINKSERAWHNRYVKETKDNAQNGQNAGTPKPPATPPAEMVFKDGSPRFVSSPLGEHERAVQFDGKLYFDAGPRLDFRHRSTGVDYKERFAISVWVYPESDQSGAIITKMPDDVIEQDNHLPRTNGWGLFFANGKVNFNMCFSWNYDGFRAETTQTFAPRQWHHVLLVFNGLNQYNDRVAIYVDGENQPLNVLQSNFYLYWGLPETPLRIGGGGGTQFRFKGAMDELRIYNGNPTPDEIAVLACRDSLESIAKSAPKQRTPGQTAKIEGAYLENASTQELTQSLTRLRALKAEKAKLEETIPTLMVMQETPEPRPAFVLKRGAYDAPGSRVERGVPAVFRPMPADLPANRLGFAKWLVSADHPLTSRVAVNRAWGMLFGTGLVKTQEDFGTEGEPPSHPELLDWLAVEFRENGWNLKSLIRTIVTSATYRQSSIVTPLLHQKDPENRLLARSPRLRLTAEMVRDQALFVSGLLVEKIGGPSVKPYQPEGLYKSMAFADRTGYEQDRGEGLWRRSLYTYWKRTVLSPTMQVMDASAREVCTVRETRTNTPLQALDLMNDVTYVEAARLLAERMFREGGTSANDRLTWAFRTVTARKPSELELTTLRRNLDRQLDYFQRNPKEAEKFVATGTKKYDGTITTAELAGYGAVASLVLNLDEAVTRQ